MYVFPLSNKFTYTQILQHILLYLHPTRITQQFQATHKRTKKKKERETIERTNECQSERKVVHSRVSSVHRKCLFEVWSCS